MSAGEAPEAPEDSELAAEQAHLERSHEGLGAMRGRAAGLLAELRAAGSPDLDYEAALSHRVAVLGESPRPLLFGRIDEESGPSWHIGRRHVESPAGEVLVVDWRAPVSTPFYRARAGESLGLSRRRQIMVDARRVVALADDVFAGGGADLERTRLRGGDALLAELERARTGEMLDIVATIQAEQDEIIRSPLEGLLVVQGGPGTGKTAVALHRAAYLLYHHPELARSGVLVVGPSKAFLRYIAQVLPSLGEEAALQVTIADLVPRTRIRSEDGPLAARTKGDARMAGVLRRALGRLGSRLEEPVELTAGRVVLTLEPEAVNDLVETIASRGGPYKSGRIALEARLAALCRQRLRSRGRYEADEAWFPAELKASSEFRALRDRLWPRLSAHQLVSELYARPGLLEGAAAGELTGEELESLRRPRPASLRSAPWSPADLALIDEARFLLEGQGRTYGHVLVDEAQDLSPMQLRMLARRAPKGSLTALGDLAQATGAFGYGSWEEIVPHLAGEGSTSTVRREELTLGYRAPGQVLDLASRLLPASAPGVRPTRSVRPGRSAPRFLPVAEEALAPESLAEALRLAGEGLLVGLVTPAGELAARLESLAGRREDVGLLERDGLARPVTVLAAPLAKGLEFDAAVVVEPAAFAREGLRGLRLLYVALTRPIQRLSVVHSRPLPELLAAAAVRTSGAA